MELTISTLTGVGRTPIHTVHKSVDSPRADVVVVHGVAEHAGRYDHVFEALVAAGFNAHALDHRGHGRSGGRLGLVDSWSHLIDDLESLIAEVRSGQDVQRPLFVIGHSMGGLATGTVLARHRVGVDAAVISGVPLVPTVEVPPIFLQLATVISRFAPTLPITELDSSQLSHDPAVGAAYDADPYVYRGKMMARTGSEILAAVDWLTANLAEIDQPVLLIAGSEDAMTSAEGTKVAFDGVTSADKSMQIYEDLYHEVFNEVDKDEIIAETIAWLENHL